MASRIVELKSNNSSYKVYNDYGIFLVPTENGKLGKIKVVYKDVDITNEMLHSVYVEVARYIKRKKRNVKKNDDVIMQPELPLIFDDAETEKETETEKDKMFECDAIIITAVECILSSKEFKTTKKTMISIEKIKDNSVVYKLSFVDGNGKKVIFYLNNAGHNIRIQ